MCVYVPGGGFLGGGGMVAMCSQSGRSCVWLVELHSRTCCVLSAIGQFRSISDVNILTGHSISSSHTCLLPLPESQHLYPQRKQKVGTRTGKGSLCRRPRLEVMGNGTSLFK